MNYYVGDVVQCSDADPEQEYTIASTFDEGVWLEDEEGEYPYASLTLVARAIVMNAEQMRVVLDALYGRHGMWPKDKYDDAGRLALASVIGTMEHRKIG
jgi:hypothetical protein